MTTPINETEKRRELQLIFLRNGWSQDYAREAAAEWPADKLTDPMVDNMRESAMRHPERQILPPGQIDLADVKSQREEAQLEAALEELLKTRNQLSRMILQSFTRAEATTEVLHALLDAMETVGVDRLAAMAEVIKEAEFLRKFHEHEKARQGETEQ